MKIRIDYYAREGLKEIIFKRTFSEINKKVKLGYSIFNVELSGLDLDGLLDDIDAVLQPTFDKPEELGYHIPESVIDVSGFLPIKINKGHGCPCL